MSDSTEETKEHIRRVSAYLGQCYERLRQRAFDHDRSKLESPEKECFDEVTRALRGLTYGSPEYRAQLGKLKPALEHHYANNSHHPEHYPDGVNGMSLLDLIEMLCDWKAAVERHADGSMKISLEHNQSRFMIHPQTQAILENTAKELRWL